MLPLKPRVPIPRKAVEVGLHIDAEATYAHFNRVADLVDGFETPYGLELLATVHWVATREGADTSEKALAGVRGWNDRKKMFTERQVAIAFETLKSKGWLTAA